jgi:tetratricopeptide (TPR) repeat protein
MNWILFGLSLWAQTATELAEDGVRNLEAGNAAAARSAFEQCLKFDPAQYDALSGLGFLHYSQERFEQARFYLERALKIRSRSFQNRFLLGATFVQLNDPEGAIAQLEHAARLNRAHGDVRKLLAAQYVRTLRYRKAIALLSGEADEESCLLLIEAKQSSGDAEGAFAVAQRTVARFPQSAPVAAWLGFQLQFSGRYTEAHAMLQQALRLDPGFAAPLQIIGDVYLKEENFAEAAVWYRRAAEKTPNDPDILLGLSRALVEVNDTPGALAVLVRAAGVAPKDPRAFLQLARLYYRQGDEARAKEAAERSVQLRETTSVRSGPPAGLRSASRP